MAQRPTPKPLRGECPFCLARIASESTYCPKCQRDWVSDDASVIKFLIKSNPSLRRLEELVALTNEIQNYKANLAEEVRKQKLLDSKVLAEKEEERLKRLDYLAQIEAREFARIQSLPKWKRLVTSSTGKGVGASLLVISLLVFVVKIGVQKPIEDQANVLPTAQITDAPLSESQQLMETRALEELDSAQLEFCSKIVQYGLDSLKTFGHKSPEFLELQGLYIRTEDVVLKYNFDTGEKIENELADGWYWFGSWPSHEYGDDTQEFIDDGSTRLYEYCETKTPFSNSG
jgi:hypothetical protein